VYVCRAILANAQIARHTQQNRPKTNTKFTIVRSKNLTKTQGKMQYHFMHLNWLNAKETTDKKTKTHTYEPKLETWSNGHKARVNNVAKVVQKVFKTKTFKNQSESRNFLFLKICKNFIGRESIVR